MIKIGTTNIGGINYQGTISKALKGVDLIWEKEDEEDGVTFITSSTNRKQKGSKYLTFDYNPIDDYVIHNDYLMKYIIIDDTYKVYKKDFDIGFSAFIFKDGLSVIEAELRQGCKIVVVCTKY